eukprot:6708778-Prymnesium_polylepis.1
MSLSSRPSAGQHPSRSTAALWPAPRTSTGQRQWSRREGRLHAHPPLATHRRPASAQLPSSLAHPLPPAHPPPT